MTNAIATKLQSVIKSEGELVRVTDADAYWQDKITQVVVDSAASAYLVFPPTVEAMAEIVKYAHQEKYRLIPCGNGSKLDWGGLSKDIQLIVSTQKCARLIEHAVGDLTVTVEAGIKLADLQAQLQKTLQFLPIDPAFGEQATIGGILATADTGSWRARYGGIRDMVLGISFIRGDGTIAKAGGRVVKNVAGYDLMKLFTGSYGTLGIIAQVTLRTYPLPEASKTVALIGDYDAIAQAMKTLRNSGLTPTAADLVSTSAIDKLGIGKNTALVIRFQTISQSIAQQISQLESIARQLNLQVSYYQDQDETNLWQKLTQIVRVPHSEIAIISKIGILPNAAVELLQKLDNLTDSQSLVMIHAGGGIGHLQLNNEDTKVIEQARSICNNHSGFLTLLTAPQSVKQEIDIWGYSGNAAQMMQAIKQQFDRYNIFSPGRFIDGI